MTTLADEVEVVAFDIFGTTVDWWTGVATQVAEIMAGCDIAIDSGELASSWRERYLPSMARVRSGDRPWTYLDSLHRESLDEILDLLGIAGRCNESTREQLVRTWHRLPAWHDMDEGLLRLRQRYTVIALSNGGFALLTRLIKHEGLTFDAVLSAQNARMYKPDPHVYRMAADLLDVAPDKMLMVAAHHWDIQGARTAGLRTAFLERPAEKGPHHTADRATDAVCDITVASCTDLARSLGC